MQAWLSSPTEMSKSFDRNTLSRVSLSELENFLTHKTSLIHVANKIDSSSLQLSAAILCCLDSHRTGLPAHKSRLPLIDFLEGRSWPQSTLE